MGSKTSTATLINELLPQTQCQQCGYEGCLPYAKALANHEAPVNLCIPGGEEVMLDLAEFLHKMPITVKKGINQTVYIDEELCIGCKACIRACPVDAIVGTSKRMHTIINQECTGCKLCIPVCPVDCIFPNHENLPYLPKNPFLSQSNNPRKKAAEHAKIRYNHRIARLEKLKKEKQTYLTNKTMSQQNPSESSNLMIQALLTLAKERAASRKDNRIKIEDDSFIRKKILIEQKRSAFRKAQKDFRYGNHEEKKQALQFLKQWKKEQQNN